MEQYFKKMAVIDRNKNSITLSNDSIIEIPFEIEDDVSIEELSELPTHSIADGLGFGGHRLT